jgi:hypothetical protein
MYHYHLEKKNAIFLYCSGILFKSSYLGSLLYAWHGALKDIVKGYHI